MKMDQKDPSVGAIVGEYPISYEIYTVTNDSKKDVEISYSTSFTSDLDKAVQMFSTIPEGVEWKWAEYNAKNGEPEHGLRKGMCAAAREPTNLKELGALMTSWHPDNPAGGPRLLPGAYLIYAASKTGVLVKPRGAYPAWVSAAALEQVDPKFCQQ